MKILVTGAAGFIGSHLSERLAEDGHTVVGVDSFDTHYSPELKRKNVEDIRAKGVQFENLDLVSEPLDHVMKGIDVVYHLAAQPGISADVSFERYVRNNILSTKRLLESVLENGVGYFVNTATSSIYGRVAGGDEDSAPEPISYYGVTKLAAEQLVLSCVRNEKLKGCSVRPFSVYGPRERPDKLFPNLILSALSGASFPLFEGSTDHVRSYTYVGDIVDGMVSILDAQEECNGEVINLGTEETHTTGECIALVEELLGTKINIDAKPKRPGDQNFTKANTKKAQKLLNYEPQTSLREGVVEEIEWYREAVWDRV